MEGSIWGGGSKGGEGGSDLFGGGGGGTATAAATWTWTRGSRGLGGFRVVGY